MKITSMVLAVVLVFVLLFSSGTSLAATPVEKPESGGNLLAERGIAGPFVNQPVTPYVFNGDLRDLPQLPAGNPPKGGIVPQAESPWKLPPASPPNWIDPVTQTSPGTGQMPDPIIDFPGLSMADGGGWTPPDTNGDVGPSVYVETVNIAMGVYDKATGAELVSISFDTLFQGTGTPCDTQNRGDVIALYDELADRWLVSDFSLPAGGPYYECIAVSQTGDPVSGGWYFYALIAGFPGQSWNDYPKLGVWPDAYYMSANMFDPWIGARVWALDRNAMLNGQPMNSVYFDAGSAYASLLPSNMKGDLPPAGSPNYFAAIEFPNLLDLWKFHVDWDNPGNSTFTGPTQLTVSNIGFIWEIPQKGTPQTLDSLGDRLMFSLHYRNRGSYESLWVNHTVANGGVAGVRWYEVRDPGGTPFLYQEGTYQPDNQYRWMGSVATDKDGNMALGYSISSSTMYPGIRYTGRLFGETPGLLPQGEASMEEGTGSQTSSNRWGDYSLMTIDPVDDCTFWYTQEYYVTSGGNWQTRIGSFKFPTCGQPKGWIGGLVYNADNQEGIPGAPLVAQGVTTTLTLQADATGVYSMTLPSGTYTVTAGPVLPGFPEPVTISNVNVTAGQTTSLDIPLAPVPDLVGDSTTIDDNVPGANGNGYAEPGESGIQLWESITNIGNTTATNVTGHVEALTPGVTIDVADAAYPDVGAGASASNLTPFAFSIDPAIACGTQLEFMEILNADQGVYTTTFQVFAKALLPRTSAFFDDMENGSGNWTTGGALNKWAITTEKANSPTHAWSDSPNAIYSNNTNAWVRMNTLDLTGKYDVQLSFFHQYALESGWDYGHLEYSLDGGTTWNEITAYSGFQDSWLQETFDAGFLDNQSRARVQFRIETDTGVQFDGWYIDDVDVTYVPFECTYPVAPPATPILVEPPDGTLTGSHAITLTWTAGEGNLASGYHLDLDGSVITTTETSYAATLDTGVHTWSVEAYNQYGGSGYSDPWTVEVVDAPESPMLIAPADGSITSTHTLDLSWLPGAGGAPAGYNLDVDGAVITTTETSASVTLDAGVHTWQVRSFNVAGTSEYSPPWTFEIADLPGVPALLAPADGTIQDSRKVTLSWEAGGGAPAQGFEVDIDGVAYDSTGTSLEVTLAPGAHTWRVRAYTTAGYSDYSASWTFTIRFLAYLPVLQK